MRTGSRLLIFLLSVGCASADLRDFTSADGSRNIRAELRAVEEEKVVIVLENGRSMTVSPAVFSESDRKFIAGWRETPTIPDSGGDWVDLFDSRTLDGWKPNSDADAYSVANGILRLQATHQRNRSHLFYVGDDDELDLFRNFELEAVTRGEANSNSGIFFHTDTATRDQILHLANGYEVQLNTTEKERRKTGSLYDVVDLAEPVLKDETEWFTVRIRVENRRIQVWINDTRTVDYTEPENVVAQRSPKRKGRHLRENGGGLALQAHDKDSTFYFKSIRIRRLP